MKKLVSLILTLAMVLCVVSFASADETYRVAMITDSGDHRPVLQPDDLRGLQGVL